MVLTNGLDGIGKLAHRHLLLLVAVAYALAAVWPGLGLCARECVVLDAGATAVTVPMVLLAVLLFNASLGASAGELGMVVRRPRTVLAGVAANLLTPLAFLLVLRCALVRWHSVEEADCLVLGLTVVAAMPVAGSSTAWTQHAGGNVALSLALVLLSTLLSPLTTPLLLAGVGGVTPGAGFGGAGHDTTVFLLTIVVAPSALGMLVRRLVGDFVTARWKPGLRAISALILLFLCYANAAVALPQVVARPDWDYLALVVVAVTGLCVTAFASGWLLAKGLRASQADGRALMFGLGMNNNGTGLVLAASVLGALPWAVVPVLAYNLVQHIIAGGVARWVTMREGEAHRPVPEPIP